MENIDSFKIIGIETNTTNENGKSAEDLGKLWEQFYSENISNKIPSKKNTEIYSIYTNYESDYTGKYTCIIGMKVDSLDNIPNGLIGCEFESGKYQKFLAKGNMPNAILETWQEIWKKDQELNRKYTADFEVYGKNSQNGENSEVQIYIAKK
ncbi:GyrI-like domain-containing protein [Winogradskyella psychrotolerans]|uniref:GyrI-like domain-containing protein n=1 Tax=Winogradskyella psychrotolerans TaxID=1344585 RepID=UPI001C076AE6|nr:GyrI-like domain-containing protein [Winogradskyella psychrotolerans]MBU2928846.1 GyrI-like domain-containing protein [Winogradskyella psychrotolerans]